MVGFLLAFLATVDYTLMNDYELLPTGQVTTKQIDNNYSLFDQVEKSKTIINKPKPKIATKHYVSKKPESTWSFPGETKEDLIKHLKTHKNHKETFKDMDLTKLDFQTLRDIHGLDHEKNFKLGDLFSKNCTLTATRNKRILFFTSNGCPACKTCFAKFAPWLRKAGWTIGPNNDNHIQIINIDHDRYALSKYKISSLPTFVVVEDDKVIRRTGYLEKEDVPKLLGL